MAGIETKEAVSEAPPSAFAPFKHHTFTILWLATVISNIGTWMHDVGAGWLMASMVSSPLLVALVQTATTLPLFLFALPAGALADIIDRRHLLLVVQVLMSITAVLLGVTVMTDRITPGILLAFTFAMGVGAALMAPAWQAIVPKLVPFETLQQAVAANSVGINISRAIGPALGGVLITTTAISVPFLLNGLSFLVVVCALLWWRPAKTTQQPLPPEHLLGAIRSGLRYAFHSKPLTSTLARALGFFLFASAYWALLPLIAKTTLAGGAELYGLLLGAVGLGAVVGAFAIPKLKPYFGADKLVALGTLGSAIAMSVLAVGPHPSIAVVVCLLAGMSWITVLTSLNVSAQVALPDWVRARGLAIFVTFFFGSMSLGSLFWGQVASMYGVTVALLGASVGALVTIPFTWRFKLQTGARMDLTPSMHWPEPVVSREPECDQGPVMVTLEYRIDPVNRADFLAEAQELRWQRQRDGAYEWGIFEDAAEPGKFLECFFVASWLEHLRQHHRVTRSDQALQESLLRFQVDSTPPVVSHFIAPARDGGHSVASEQGPPHE